MQIVLQDPRLGTVADAVSKANHRLTQAEAAQAKSIGAINNQIADMATAIDKRLQRETREREQVQHALNVRIREIETQSAKAVTDIGDKMIALTDEISHRADVRGDKLKHDIKEDLSAHRQELETFKSEIGRHIEAIEDDQRNTLPSIERRLVTITTRLDAVEAYYQQNYHANEPGQMESPVQEDAFSPIEPAALEPVSPPVELTQVAPPAPAPEPVQQIVEPETPSHIPQEYVPQEYVPEQSVTPETVAMDQAVGTQQSAAQVYAPPATAPDPYAPVEIAGGEPQVYENPYANAGAPAAPGYAYQNPAMDTGSQYPGIVPPADAFVSEIAPPPYAPQQIGMAAEETMDAARPGGDIVPKRKKSLFSLKRSTSVSDGSGTSPIKLFALMTALAVIGLFAVQKFVLSGPDQTVSNPPAQAGPTAVVDDSGFMDTGENLNVNFEDPIADPTQQDPNSIVRSVESVEPIGDYTENLDAPEIDELSPEAASPGKITLKSAATNGDRIAQYQLGLTHLEAKRNAEAVRLIRLSANQGLAAAQYRLAKLYESGIGVEQNLATAMRLLKQAANNGNRIAMHDYGHYFATGTAMDAPDFSAAANWFLKAAERGVLDSQFNLGVLYQEGSGVTKSLTDSYVWYAIAGAQGDELAVQRTQLLERQMSADELDLAKSRVAAYRPKRIDNTANGIFASLPWQMPASSTRAQQRQNIQVAQKFLINLGYEPGSPDGAIGPKTKDAIIRFERANGLPETGVVSSGLLQKLAAANAA